MKKILLCLAVSVAAAMFTGCNTVGLVSTLDEPHSEQVESKITEDLTNLQPDVLEPAPPKTVTVSPPINEKKIPRSVPKTSRPATFGTEPKAMVDGLEQWINAVEFDVYDALRVCVEKEPFANLVILNRCTREAIRDLAVSGNVVANQSAALNAIDVRIKTIDQTLRQSDSSMKSAYAEASDAAARLKKRAERTQERLNLLRTRLNQLQAAILTWSEYYDKTSVLVGKNAANDGLRKIIVPTFETWRDTSMRGRE